MESTGMFRFSSYKKIKNIGLLFIALISSFGMTTSLLRNNFSTSSVNALGLTAININQGPTTGGTNVTLTGDFGIPGTKVTQISVGGSHVCALAANNQIYCWGTNSFGELGNNSTIDSSVPIAVDTSGVLNGKTIAQVSAGSTHTCAIDTAGQAYCWGDSGYPMYSALGDGNMLPSSVPIAVNTSGALNGKILAQISTGNEGTCALDTANQAYCWGSITLSTVPVAIDTSTTLSGKTIKQIVAGNTNACVLDTDGHAYCWGNYNNGTLGDGSTTGSGYATIPVAVDTSGVLNGKILTQISITSSFVCAIDTAGQAYCWGNNYYGQLGNGSTTNGLAPTTVDTSGVLNGKTLIQIAAGIFHACAVDTAGQAYCWGFGSNGNLGNGSTTKSTIPVAVDTSGVLNGKTISQISTNGLQTCAIDIDGHAYCWGAVGLGTLGNNDEDGIDCYDPSTFNHAPCVPTPVPVHTVSFDTGSMLPDADTPPISVVFSNTSGTPSPCINVVVAPDGLSLTCTTTAHPAGRVDITISNGTNTVTLPAAFEYVNIGVPDTGFQN